MSGITILFIGLIISGLLLVWTNRNNRNGK